MDHSSAERVLSLSDESHLPDPSPVYIGENSLSPQTASSSGDMRAILSGLFTVVAVIVLIDQLVWRPVIAWPQKFKLEQTEAADVPQSPILDLLRHSRAIRSLTRASALHSRMPRPLSWPPSSLPSIARSGVPMYRLAESRFKLES